MFVVCMVIIVSRKLIAELEDYCSNNGGLDKKFKCSIFRHGPFYCGLLNNATPAIYSCISMQVLGKWLD